ncbi:hypothetical protein Glove_164g20 [Diversispora epigaea]|uniref:FAR1 domain-containing protein n=1 Tax=Diversispora epigaea TaxID=1348612 RepID=A0A397IVU5_9GLOM|nr:hypothetical protein Glove_164g20 [Diversispora epigaea]
MSNISNIEPKEGDFYTSHNNFVEAVKEYAKKKEFQVCLGKVEKNAVGIIHKRTILCNQEGDPEKISISANIRNRASQHCNCKFLVRANVTTLDPEKTLYQKKEVFHPSDPYPKDPFDLKSLTQGDSFLDVKELWQGICTWLLKDGLVRGGLF